MIDARPANVAHEDGGIRSDDGGGGAGAGFDEEQYIHPRTPGNSYSFNIPAILV